MTARLALVTDQPKPDAPAIDSHLDQAARACVARRAHLKRALAAEEARFIALRKLVAKERGELTIWPEQFEREFGS